MGILQAGASTEDKGCSYLAGTYTIDAAFDELVRCGKKTQAEADTMKQLTNEVQYAVLTRHLGAGKSWLCYLFLSISRWLYFDG